MTNSTPENLPPWKEIGETIFRKFFSTTREITGKVVESTPLPESSTSAIQVILSLGIILLGIGALKKLEKPIIGLGVVSVGVLLLMGLVF